MHYSLIVQPCSKKILEKASKTELLAYLSTSWTAESPISTACLSCFGVTLATCCRQAREAWTQQAAEVDAVVLAKQLASQCQRLIQGMQLNLALPELKIFFCSLTCDLVTGRPLALKLGLSRRNRQVQLQDGQLRLCKVLPHKNLAECLTKNLSTASFHRLLPKLMVHTRAVKAQALLTRLGGENQASFCSSSFFIGMVALNPPMALTRASSTYSLQLLSLTVPELSMNQLQKRIAPRTSFQCQKPMQISFASLTGYSLSKQMCQKSFQSLTDDKLELGSPESESLSEQLRRKTSASFSDQLCTTSFHIFHEDFCKKGFPSFSAQLCTMIFHIFCEDFCRKGFHSFSDQLCTESFAHWISQPQLDLATSLSLQQLRQKNLQLHSVQLSFPKFSQKNLESFSEQLCRQHSESLTDDKLELGDHLCPYRCQSFSFQSSRISLEEFIPQLDLVSLSLATELGSRSSSKQLQTTKSETSSFEPRASHCTAGLGSTQLGHKQPEHSNHSFQLPDAQLCQTMAQQRTQKEASRRASKPSLITTNLARRSSSKRSSPSALPTSSRKSTTSSLQTTLFAIFVQLFVHKQLHQQHLPQHRLLEE